MSRVVLICVLVGLGSCGGSLDAARDPASASREEEAKELRGGAPAPEAVAAPKPAPGRSRTVGDLDGEGDAAPVEASEEPSDEAPGEAAREWFPEAFLWAPRVVTDEAGRAAVELVVPDTLTTWRVLALAHSADGQQAGAVHSFVGALPSWVELAPPPVLTVGDTLRVPVQVVHEADGPLRSSLRVRASGAAEVALVWDVQLDARSRQAEAVPLKVLRHGTLRLEAALEGVDALVREVAVRPAGRPVVARRGGLLGDRVALPLASEASDLAGSVQVWVYAGPLDLLRRELERLSQSELPWSGAYGWALADHLEALAARTGAEVDAAVVRRLRIRAWQRLRATTHAPGADAAAEILLALRESGGTAEVDALVRRLAYTVEQAQRGDGTWAHGASPSLQQVIVQTAIAGRALPEGSKGARLKASGALERFAREVRDPYTAAVVAASGLVGGERLAGLRSQVREALVAQPDGSVRLDVPAGVLNSWGGAAQGADALAWAATALSEEPLEVVSPMLATLLAGYDVAYGFQAGAANPLVLRALVDRLPVLDRPARVSLRAGGAELVVAQLEVGGSGAPAVLHTDAAPAGAGLELVVEPSLPGLGWTAVHRRWVPWDVAGPPPGFAFRVRPPQLSVGQRGVVGVEIEGASGSVVTVDVGLPPGAEIGELASSYPGFSSVSALGDRVRLVTEPLRAAELLRLEVPVRAALAGELSSVPHVFSVDGGEPVALPPSRWSVR